MNLPLTLFTLLAVAFVIRTLWLARAEIKPAALRAALKAGTAVLIDVRESAEWTSGVARHATFLPLSDLRGSRRQWSPFIEKNRGKQLLVYCHSGNRSAAAAALLRREGLAALNAGSLNAGSLNALDHAGWPVCRARR